MRTFAQKPKVRKQGTSAQLPQLSRSRFGQGHEVNSVVHLQPAAGERLPVAVQNKMERAFDFDFSAVRIHQDSRAAAAGAVALAQGTNLHFAPGHYAPESRAGQVVLGHELAHVMQQAAGRVCTPAQALGGAINDDPELEREADQMGERAADGQRASDQAKDTSEGLERRLDRLIGGRLEEQPVQRKVEMPPNSNLPDLHKYLTKSGNIYSYEPVVRTKGKLSFEIFTSLFNSPRVFKLQGDSGPSAQSSLLGHMRARVGVVEFADKKQYKFTGGFEDFHMNPKYWWWDKKKKTFGFKEGVDPLEARKDLTVHPEEYTIGCAAATKITVQGGGESNQVQGTTAVDQDWVPGESGYIENKAFDGRPGLEGENIIYMGGKEFWGHFGNEKSVKPYQEWFDMVNGWNTAAKLQPDRNWPSKGLNV